MTVQRVKIGTKIVKITLLYVMMFTVYFCNNFYYIIYNLKIVSLKK